MQDSTGNKLELNVSPIRDGAASPKHQRRHHSRAKAASKDFAPLLSDLDGRWGRVVEVIALASDPFRVDAKAPQSDPSHYWRGTVPQLLLLDNSGKVLLDVDGRMDMNVIESAISKATGIDLPSEQADRSSTSFNEINSGFGS